MSIDLYKKNIKYIKKYINLKFYEILNFKQIGGADNINIDGINFGLFYRFKSNGYKYLVVRSKIADLSRFLYITDLIVKDYGDYVILQN